ALLAARLNQQAAGASVHGLVGPTARAAASLASATPRAGLHIARLVMSVPASALGGLAATRAIMIMSVLLAVGLAAGSAALVLGAMPHESGTIVSESVTMAGLQSEAPRPGQNDRPRHDLYGDALPPGAIARMGTTRFRHGGYIDAIAYSTDGNSILSRGNNQV